MSRSVVSRGMYTRLAYMLGPAPIEKLASLFPRAGVGVIPDNVFP